MGWSKRMIESVGSQHQINQCRWRGLHQRMQRRHFWPVFEPNRKVCYIVWVYKKKKNWWKVYMVCVWEGERQSSKMQGKNLENNFFFCFYLKSIYIFLCQFLMFYQVLYFCITFNNHINFCLICESKQKLSF